MFAPNRSSPKTTSVRAAKPTMMESYMKTRSKMSRKDVVTSQTTALETTRKLKTKAHGIQRVISEEESSDAGVPDKPSVRVVRDAAEGRAFLEEEALISSEDVMSMDLLVDTLIQVSVTEGMPPGARCPMRSVALILNQLNAEAANDALVGLIEKRVEDAVARASEKAADALKELVHKMATELKAASTDMASSATQIAASITLYRDALKSAPHQAVGASPMDTRVRAREGVKARQILVDAGAPGRELLADISNTDLVHSANGALESLDGCTGHKVVSARRLNNGGILLEMNSDTAAGWINSLDNRASFLGQFVPDAMVKERAFSLVVQFVPLHFRLDRDSDM